MPSEMKRLRQLEDENAKLKRLVADLSLDKAILQDMANFAPGPLVWVRRHIGGISSLSGTLASASRSTSGEAPASTSLRPCT